ncbi:MAG: helix-turn-helix transcriptional regulator [Bryobacteraceae bacterium]|jgi:transcriptional regulator with XRE-family HTH domain
MSDFEMRLAADLSQGQEYRDAYSEAFSNEYLATQIQILRKQHGWTQAELGQKIGSNQGRVSVYEDEDYGKWSLETLRKMASVFGLWVKVSFESYSSLIQEAAHFQPQQLLRSDFENDPDVRRWLPKQEASGGEDGTLSIVLRWAEAERPDRAQLIGWLQGFGLPQFSNRELTPVQEILESVPVGEERVWNVLARELADVISADDNEAAPLVRNIATYRENLFGLAKAIGPRRELQDGLDRAYQRAWQRFEREGRSGLGYEGETWLLEAMIRNQVDARWEEIWNRYLNGGGHPEEFKRPAHPFLPGGALTGIRGLLGMPQSPEYWRGIARGVRDLERRLLSNGYARLDSSPNVMDELAKAIGLIFDWWPDPRAAQALLQGSIDLMSSGTWSMYSQAAWAYGACRKGWSDAVRTGRNDLERKTYADVLASGLKLYTDWQLARRDRSPSAADSAEIEKLQKDSEQSSMVVIGRAA